MNASARQMVKGFEARIERLVREAETVRAEYETHGPNGDKRSALTLRDVKRAERAMERAAKAILALDHALTMGMLDCNPA